MRNFLVNPFIGELVMFPIKRHGWLMANNGQTSLMVSSVSCYLCRLMISFMCFETREWCHICQDFGYS